MAAQKTHRQCYERALACVGAVVGAGFASGREMVRFFSQYGVWSWGLIVLSSAVMVTLYVLLLGRLRKQGSLRWCDLYAGQTRLLRFVGMSGALMLMGVTGGAMLSAAGELFALVVPAGNAYWLGIVLTLLLASLLSLGNLKPLSWMSLLLLGALAAALFLMLSQSNDALVLISPPVIQTAASPLVATGCAIAYAGLNMAVGLGVVCECGSSDPTDNCRLPVFFGFVMLMLMFASNVLYLRFPAVQGEALPMVVLLRRLGKAGYFIGASLLYLAVATSLMAVIRALRCQFASWLPKRCAIWAALLVPLLFSLVGFSQIIETLYPLLGALCLLVLLLPMLHRSRTV